MTIEPTAISESRFRSLQRAIKSRAGGRRKKVIAILEVRGRGSSPVAPSTAAYMHISTSAISAGPLWVPPGRNAAGLKAMRDHASPTPMRAQGCSNEPSEGLGRLAVEKADHRHCQLLGARREVTRRCAAEERDELAPLHVLPSIQGLHPTTPW